MHQSVDVSVCLGDSSVRLQIISADSLEALRGTLDGFGRFLRVWRDSPVDVLEALEALETAEIRPSVATAGGFVALVWHFPKSLCAELSAYCVGVRHCGEGVAQC